MLLQVQQHSIFAPECRNTFYRMPPCAAHEVLLAFQKRMKSIGIAGPCNRNPAYATPALPVHIRGLKPVRLQMPESVKIRGTRMRMLLHMINL